MKSVRHAVEGWHAISPCELPLRNVFRASFSAAGKFDRRDYGLTWNVALETGGILVSNEVKINIEAQVVLQTEAE